MNFFRQNPATARATTAWRTFFDERWSVQRALIFAGGVPRAHYAILANTVTHEYIARLRMGHRRERWREALQGARAFWPIFARAPITLLRCAASRVRGKWSRGKLPGGTASPAKPLP